MYVMMMMTVVVTDDDNDTGPVPPYVGYLMVGCTLVYLIISAFVVKACTERDYALEGDGVYVDDGGGDAKSF